MFNGPHLTALVQRSSFNGPILTVLDQRFSLNGPCSTVLLSSSINGPRSGHRTLNKKPALVAASAAGRPVPRLASNGGFHRLFQQLFQRIFRQRSDGLRQEATSEGKTRPAVGREGPIGGSRWEFKIVENIAAVVVIAHLGRIHLPGRAGIIVIFII